MKSYSSPFNERYASQEMRTIFSPHYKYSTWRKLWLALAEAEQQLGLPISNEQIEEMASHIDDIDYSAIDAYEKRLEHDVMAHIHGFADLCPKAKPIIHLGATSCYVTDNTDVIQTREGLKLLGRKLALLLQQLCSFAAKFAGLPCLGYTHFQPAQLTTVGKRACLWAQDFYLDLQELDYRLGNLSFLGAKGATGTQASFLALFHGNQEKVKELEKAIAEKMGFHKIFPISGQTYSRKQDAYTLSALAGIGASAHKFATDLRLLAHLKELEEPFLNTQVGSSAMPYKRNPVLSERICGLSRFLFSLNENGNYTAATQWLERSLDDSANRRLALPEAFLCADAILQLLLRVTANLVVNPALITKHVEEELPFMATENILMASVAKGTDRQEIHERLRKHSMEAGRKIKEGGKNDLLDQIESDPSFFLNQQELNALMDTSSFIGRAPQQVEEFVGSQALSLLIAKYQKQG